MKRFRGGLIFKALRLVNHSTLGLRVIEKKEEDTVGLADLISKHLKFSNLDQGNVLHGTIFISNIEVNVYYF